MDCKHPSVLTECLKRSLSWSVYSRSYGPGQSTRLIAYEKSNKVESPSLHTDLETSRLIREEAMEDLCGNASKRDPVPNERQSSESASQIEGLHALETSASSKSRALTEAMRFSVQVTILDVSGICLAELPESIGDLKRLTDLKISDNDLNALPQSLCKLKELTTLDLQKNRLEELPWAICQCKSLRSINADFNSLTSLPESVGRLTKLARLSLHFNRLESLPRSMSTMANLVELDVSFNRLTDIPENVCFIASLVRFNIASNFSELKSLPDSIGRLQNLQELDVSFNNLTYLPDSLAMLTNLQTLRVEGNPLYIPPVSLAVQGKEVILNYMNRHVEKESRKSRMMKGRFWRFLYKMTMQAVTKRNR